MTLRRSLLRAAVQRVPSRTRAALRRELARADSGAPTEPPARPVIPPPPPPAPSEAAPLDDVAPDFFRVLGTDGDFDRAAVAMTRRLIDRDDLGRARAIAQVWQRYDELRPVADLCLALCSIVDLVPEVAWRLFTRNDLATVLRWTAAEYMQVGYRIDPATASSALRRALGGDIPLKTGPAVWLDIALAAFAGNDVDLAEAALRRATAALKPASAGRELRNRAANLRAWIAQARLAAAPVVAPADTIPFALVGYRHPDRRAVSADLSDPLETLAALGHLVRHGEVPLDGDPDLVAAAERLRTNLPANRRLPGQARTVRLYEVDRDASSYAVVPDGTWLLVSDWLANPLGDGTADLPLDPRLRPLFVSFAITPRQLAAPGAVGYLRRHAPIGCRDRATVYLLHAAGIDAFLTGTLTATLDTVIAPRRPAPATADVYVDVDVDVDVEGHGRRHTRLAAARRTRSLAANLSGAAATLQRYRDNGRRIITSDVRLHAAARAVGCDTELRPDDPVDGAVTDHLDMTSAEFDALRRGLAEKLAVVLDAVLDGADEEAVRAVWRDACAAEVAAVRRELAAVDFAPTLSFDLGQVCALVRAAAVTIERSDDTDLVGTEINVEFSADKNYKRQLEVTLDSIVERTQRPVRAFVLCRGHDTSDFEIMARAFPTISFVWLATDAVDYGEIPGKNPWVTIVTMDRTILPELLPDVDRIIHFDLDAMCLADLGDLYDVDLESHPIAAVSASPRFISGFETVHRSAALLRSIGETEAAHEFMLRMHREHPFDFDVFNAGIMVMDLETMRADDFCGRYLPFVQRYGINGQNVLAMYTGRRRKVVDRDWNRLMRLELPDDPKIAHWAGPWKPWRRQPYVYRRELWREQEARFLQRVTGPVR